MVRRTCDRGRCSARLRAVVAAACFASCAWTTAAAAQIAVVCRVPADRAVLEQLAGLVDEPVQPQDESAPRGLAAVMTDATQWPVRYVVVVDRGNDSVHVLRPSDQTIVSRVLSAELLADSHYAVALATAELLEWLGATPRARAPRDSAEATASPAETAVPATPADHPPAASPAADEADSRSAGLGVALAVGLGLSASPGADVSLARLAGELELQLGRGRRSPWLAFGLSAAAPGSFARELAAGASAAGVQRVEYSSTELGAHAALGVGRDGAAFALGPAASLAFVDVSARGGGEREVGAHDATAASIGLGLWLRYPIAWGLGLGLAARALWVPSNTRYRVEGERVLTDGPLRVQTQLGLVWESALAPF